MIQNWAREVLGFPRINILVAMSHFIPQHKTHCSAQIVFVPDVLCNNSLYTGFNKLPTLSYLPNWAYNAAIMPCSSLWGN